MPYRDTLQHAHEALGALDPAFQFLDAWEGFLQSPARDSSRGETDDLHAWCMKQIRELSGARSFAQAIQHPDVLSLLAFGYLRFAKALPAQQLPRLERSMPLPKRVAAIETDFFPVLLKAIRDNAHRSASFRSELAEAESNVKRLAERLRAAPGADEGGGPAQTLARSGADDASFGEAAASIVVFGFFLGWLSNAVKKSK